MSSGWVGHLPALGEERVTAATALATALAGGQALDQGVEIHARQRRRGRGERHAAPIVRRRAVVVAVVVAVQVRVVWVVWVVVVDEAWWWWWWWRWWWWW